MGDLRRLLFALFAFAQVVTHARLGAAQQAVALDRFEPSPAGDPFLSVPSPGIDGELRLAVGFALSYARSPLLLVAGTDDEPEEAGEIVDHQLVLHNLVSLELARRVKIELDVPATLSQGGDSPSHGSVGVLSPSGATMNDVRTGLRVELLRQDGWWPSAALSFTTWFPSGDDDAYTSSGLVRYAPALLLGASQPALGWAITVGRRFQAYRPAGAWFGGSELTLGAAAAGRLEWFQLGPELYASTVADGGTDAFSRRTTSVEALLAARLALGPVSLRLAGGPGLTSGYGTPRYRFVGSFIWSPELDRGRGPELDRGVRDEPRALPEDASDAEHRALPSPGGAKAPAPPGPAVPRALADRDVDGVADAVDACPDERGVRSDNPAQDGCPSDRDGDAIADAEDACPEEKGERTPAPTTNGCPRLVRLVGSQIVIAQQVRFATGSDEIDPSSAELLGQVAQLLGDHSEIARVAVDGHTDDVGPIRRNVELSQRRALAVVRWLNEHGVDARRTEARGFGPHRPMAPNETEAGRAQNRRVEFQILRRTAEGQAGWRDGPLE